MKLVLHENTPVFTDRGYVLAKELDETFSMFDTQDFCPVKSVKPCLFSTKNMVVLSLSCNRHMPIFLHEDYEILVDVDLATFVKAIEMLDEEGEEAISQDTFDSYLDPGDDSLYEKMDMQRLPISVASIAEIGLIQLCSWAKISTLFKVLKQAKRIIPFETGKMFRLTLFPQCQTSFKRDLVDWYSPLDEESIQVYKRDFSIAPTLRLRSSSRKVITDFLLDWIVGKGAIKEDHIIWYVPNEAQAINLREVVSWVCAIDYKPEIGVLDKGGAYVKVELTGLRTMFFAALLSRFKEIDKEIYERVSAKLYEDGKFTDIKVSKPLNTSFSLHVPSYDAIPAVEIELEKDDAEIVSCAEVLVKFKDVDDQSN